MRRVSRGRISSELIMCGGCVHSILLSTLVARCLETIDVCIRRMFVFMSVVTVCGNVYCVVGVLSLIELKLYFMFIL